MTIELGLSQLKLHEVISVQATQEEDVYIVTVDLTDTNGERYVAPYASKPDDTFGLNPQIRVWLADNLATTEVIPSEVYHEAKITDDPLPVGQLRMRLIQRHQLLPSEILRRINADPDSELLETYWEYWSAYARDNEHFIRIMQLAGLSDEQVDQLWEPNP